MKYKMRKLWQRAIGEWLGFAADGSYVARIPSPEFNYIGRKYSDLIADAFPFEIQFTVGDQAS